MSKIGDVGARVAACRALRHLPREFDEIAASLNDLDVTSEWFDRRRNLSVERIRELDERRERIAERLEEIGTQAALVATHDCDARTSRSALFLCRDILDRLDKLKLGMI